ncbi:MAG: hypothetical protein RL603_301 [Pseudomonadota bacterium]|jgi:16S rRNA processing protein RimM
MGTERWVELGRLGRPKGLRGWLHVQSWTDPPEALLDYPTWHLVGPQGQREVLKPAEVRANPSGLEVRLEGFASREAAEVKVGWRIEVPRTELPPVEAGEHYREDLIGFQVCNGEGVVFGVLDSFVDLPGNAVMVVRGERERWLPVTKQHVLSIDTDARRIQVDWPADF